MNKEKILTIDSIVQLKDNQLLISHLGDDLIMMDIQNGSYLSLNKTGRVIWEQIEKPVKVRDIIQNLTKRFSIDEETCTSETMNFLFRIAKQNILKIVQK